MELVDLERKKRDLCVEFMKLGMDFDSACVAAEIGGDAKDRLASDEEFVSEVNFTLARKEADLLRKLNEVAEENAERGETKQLERMLELLNPARYSKVTKLSHQIDNAGASGGKITVDFQDAGKGE